MLNQEQQNLVLESTTRIRDAIRANDIVTLYTENAAIRDMMAHPKNYRTHVKYAQHRKHIRENVTLNLAAEAEEKLRDAEEATAHAKAVADGTYIDPLVAFAEATANELDAERKAHDEPRRPH